MICFSEHFFYKKNNFLCKEFSWIQPIWTYHNHCYETIPSLLIWFEHSCVWLTVLVSENTEMNYTQYLSISFLKIKWTTKKSVKWHRNRALRKVFSWMRYTCIYLIIKTKTQNRHSLLDLYIFITCNDLLVCMHMCSTSVDITGQLVGVGFSPSTVWIQVWNSGCQV